MTFCLDSNIDMSAALALPGVVDVITTKDIPGKKFRTFCGLTEELLAEEEVTARVTSARLCPRRDCAGG